MEHVFYFTYFYLYAMERSILKLLVLVLLETLIKVEYTFYISFMTKKRTVIEWVRNIYYNILYSLHCILGNHQNFISSQTAYRDLTRSIILSVPTNADNIIDRMWLILMDWCKILTVS